MISRARRGPRAWARGRASSSTNAASAEPASARPGMSPSSAPRRFIPFGRRIGTPAPPRWSSLASRRKARTQRPSRTSEWAREALTILLLRATRPPSLDRTQTHTHTHTHTQTHARTHDAHVLRGRGRHSSVRAARPPPLSSHLGEQRRPPRRRKKRVGRARAPHAAARARLRHHETAHAYERNAAARTLTRRPWRDARGFSSEINP